MIDRNSLDRKSAFWDNWRRQFWLDKEDINAQSAAKWTTDVDNAAVDEIDSHLRAILKICTERCVDTFNEQLYTGHFDDNKEDVC